MTDTAISPLRRRMIEDMTIRQFRPTTQHNYIRFVKQFSIFFGRSPDKAAFEDVRRSQLHLTSRGVSPGNINGAMAALKFFFRITVRRFESADAQYSRVSWPHQTVLNINFALCCRIESQGSTEAEIPVAP